jgi:peptide/nickel transport system permease protein
MASFIIRRLLLGIIVLVLVSIMIFLLMRVVPGDPLILYLGGNEFSILNPEQLELLRAEYGLDKPLIVQYFSWMGGLFQGDMGRSITYHQDVTSVILQRLPVTFNLGILAFLISCIFGITFGVICAIKRGTWVDQFFSVIANLGITLPQFWVGIVLIYFLSLKLDLLPTYGYTSPFEDFGMHIKMLIMPVFCLSVFSIAGLTRQTRSSMLEVTRQDYIRTAWSKGLRERLIVTRHVVKNGLIPVVTTMGMQVSMLFGGAVLIEVVFNIPGMGRMIKDSVIQTDYQLVQGGVLVLALFIVLINILVDIVYGWIDPRIRYS